MTPHQRGQAAIEFPNDLEIVLTRGFDAPIQAGRDHMTKFDGIEANLDNVAKYLVSLLESEGTPSE